MERKKIALQRVMLVTVGLLLLCSIFTVPGLITLTSPEIPLAHNPFGGGWQAARGQGVAIAEIEDAPVPLALQPAKVRKPAAGSVSSGGGGATFDTSNVSQGYVMCKYSGTAARVKLRITKQGGTTYTYDLSTKGNYEVFPFTAGNGKYTIEAYTLVGGSQYALAHTQVVDVSLSNSTSPFLYPNQYVNFNENSKTVSKAASLAAGAGNELAVVENVYNYVIKNVSYDTDKANQVAAGQLSGYLPDVDNILTKGKGICFDYASLMTAMLRSQDIPTRMEVGYAGQTYHAWISVYIQDVGWVNDLIYFDGKAWKLMDPTFASSNNQSSEVMKYIGNGSNYKTYYYY